MKDSRFPDLEKIRSELLLSQSKLRGEAMLPETAVEKVNSYFVYKSDGKVDKWSFNSPGDCENYALLVLKEICGSQKRAVRALLRRQAFIWYVTTDTGNKHAVLEYNGRYVCNRTKRWKFLKENMKVSKWHWKYPRAILIAKLGFGGIL